MLAGPPEKVDLAEGALLIAAEEFPKMSIKDNLHEIDQLASEVGPMGEMSLPDSALRLSEILHDRHGFIGDKEGFDDPHNSFLNKVLATKEGLPILISILYMSVAKRCGLSSHGVSLPGHFAVRLHRAGEAGVLIDPFHGGRILRTSYRSLRKRGASQDLKSLSKGHDPSPTVIFTRLLNNLKQVYLMLNSFDKARWVLELILLVNVGLIPPLKFDAETADLNNSMLKSKYDFEKISPKIHKIPNGGRFVAELSLLNRIRGVLN